MLLEGAICVCAPRTHRRVVVAFLFFFLCFGDKEGCERAGWWWIRRSINRSEDRPFAVAGCGGEGRVGFRCAVRLSLRFGGLDDLSWLVEVEVYILELDDEVFVLASDFFLLISFNLVDRDMKRSMSFKVFPVLLLYCIYCIIIYSFMADLALGVGAKWFSRLETVCRQRKG